MKSKKCSTCEKTNKKIAGTQKSKRHLTIQHLLDRISKDVVLPSLNKITTRHSKKYNLNMNIEVGSKLNGRYVFYFAALPRKIKECDIINRETVSYGSLQNQGISKIKNGKFNVKLNCPQAYKDEGNTYLSHIHFIVADKNNKNWNPSLKTHTVDCNVSHKELLKIIDSNCALILNALPYQYYIKDRIPMSLSLPYTIMKENMLTKKEVDQYLLMMLVHNKKILKSVKSGKIKLNDIPIVTYCYDESCNAGHILKEKLVEMGYKNVRVYLPGIIGWNHKK